MGVCVCDAGLVVLPLLAVLAWADSCVHAWLLGYRVGLVIVCLEVLRRWRLILLLLVFSAHVYTNSPPNAMSKPSLQSDPWQSDPHVKNPEQQQSTVHTSLNSFHRY